jgi:hypothetical protein
VQRAAARDRPSAGGGAAAVAQGVRPVLGAGPVVDHDIDGDDVADRLAGGDPAGDADDHDMVDREVTRVEHPAGGRGRPVRPHPRHRRDHGDVTDPALVDHAPHRARRRPPQPQPLHDRPQLRRHRRQYPDPHVSGSSHRD